MVWWHTLPHVALGKYVINDTQLTCDSPPEIWGAGGFVDPEVIFSGHSRSGERLYIMGRSSLQAYLTMFLFSYLWNATFISSSMALLSLRTPRQNWRLMSSRGRFDLTLFWDGFIRILLESNDGADRRDGDDFRMIINGVIDNASYAGDHDKAYKIVHLGEVFRSREFKCTGKLHNLTNVDTSILRRGKIHIIRSSIIQKTLIIWSNLVPKTRII